ncbi:electron transport complex subunit RsxD [Shewanella intestini]|uniref:Ion-translocating oxidoreductase complex subunit D n=1 Tax=Shewanella intestini TaxID=2017544 RepID=A0ABS5I4P4_9GAMM|nr:MULTISPECIES: electron transport complex subunit RsxD [Shewanella]MBR9728998.1 electron transport complex subunit RsxD [Shewanella intestini]MRG36936.1 electron transport complex subunit RsxD [Shewanella sp. XMDDZSB0408]
MAFKIASSPHINTRSLTSGVMFRVVLCLIPGIGAQTYFFGFGTLVQLALAISVALTAEALVMVLRKRPVMSTLSDNSALVTASLLAIAIPPLAPWWMIVIGVLFAIVIVKHLYGGLGHNVFNPAMAAYVLLLVSFPVQMTSWVAPQSLAINPADLNSSLQVIFSHSATMTSEYFQLGYDAVAMATPLDTIKTDLSMGLTATESLHKAIFSGSVGVGWFWVNICYLLGGLCLLKMKVIRWQISTAIIVSILICSGFGFLISPDTHVSPLVHIFSGGTMLAAFFIATDPVSAATSPRGRLIFGAMIGVLIYVIRTFGGYPDAVAFAVLLANMCAPFIDHYIRPRTYGHRSGNAL